MKEAEYISESKIGQRLVRKLKRKPNTQICVFFDDKKNQCTIYDNKPSDCEMYPFDVIWYD